MTHEPPTGSTHLNYWQLDPPETTEPSTKGSPSGNTRTQFELETTFRHSGWQRRRHRTARAIERCYPGSNRLEAFKACGSQAWVFQAKDDPQTHKIVANYCRDRWCKPCARKRAHVARRVLADAIRETPVRLVTLTVKHSPLPLAQQLDKLYRDFRILRRRAWWKERVRGGVAVLEVKRSKDGKQWHPHLHMLLDAGYLNERALSAEWHQVTGDSYIVDVRAPRPGRGPVNYVTKYVTKPCTDSFTHNADLLQECIVAFQGRRTILPWGSMYHLKLSSIPDDNEYEPIAPLHEIMTLSANGVRWAFELLQRLQKGKPCEEPTVHVLEPG